MTKKLYCYVDESGQDTGGNLFIVSVVIVEEERDNYRLLCEGIEQKSGKGKIKWANARFVHRLDYIGWILHAPALKGRLFFAVFRDSKEYLSLTIQTIARALQYIKGESFSATVFIDALQKPLKRTVGLQLRRSGMSVEKVRGIAKDENEALIRLADALCGLVRDAGEGQPDLQELWDWGIKTGVIIDLGA